MSGLNALLGNALRMERRIQGVWVMAELSDVRSSGGHFYMELIEKDTRGATVAKIRANLWAGTAMALRRKFHAATGRDIASGLKVMLYGGVTHHSIYGLSFNIQDIDPSYTLGDLERLRREILETLAREGIADLNKSVPIPAAPQKIAVISAAGAAGYGDFTNQLDSSPEGFVFYPLLFGAVMQGERTASSVIAALDSIEMTLDFWDAVVIIRGGGSTTDLNGFDNLDLARRVATFPLPVIVGIGHERDRTVLDDIACIRCKTPTAVAAWLIDALRDALGRAENCVDSVQRTASARLEGDRRRIASIEAMIPALTARAMTNASLRLQTIGHKLPAIVGQQTSRQSARLASIAATLPVVAQNKMAAQGKRLAHMEQMIAALSPHNTLKRGYSITRLNGRAVTQADDIPEGALLETTLADGTIKSIKM